MSSTKATTSSTKATTTSSTKATTSSTKATPQTTKKQRSQTSYLKHYTPYKSPVLGDIYKVSFKLVGVHSSMANALRRTLLADIPVVAFDDSYDTHKMTIHKNVSALHNEFIAHRLSLVPITMYKDKSELLKIKTTYDEKTATFLYEFEHPDRVPTFVLKVKNDSDTRKRLGSNADNSIDITTAHIELVSANETTEQSTPVTSNYLIPDYITGDHVLLHRLKPMSSSEEIQEAEEIHVEMLPTISTARTHARYCPVGTVSYEFQKDSDDVLDKKFQLYIDSLQNQRVNDKLEPFSEKDIATFRGSFNTMGSERVYRRDEFGDAHTVLMTVESVGNLEADTLLETAVHILRLRILSFLKHFHWDAETSAYSYDTQKISVEHNRRNNLWEFTVQKEDHTLGNLISGYMRRLFSIDNVMGELATFTSYRYPHPLEERIVFNIGLNTSASRDQYNRVFKEYDLPTVKNTDTDAKTISTQLLIVSSYYVLGILDDLYEEVRQARRSE